MQSYLQYRQFGKQLENQIVGRHDHVDQGPVDGTLPGREEEEERHGAEHCLEESGSSSMIHGHSVRLDMVLGGELERGDFTIPSHVCPYQISTREATGASIDVRVFGLQLDHRRWGKTVVIAYEGDHDPLDPHNWRLVWKISTTFLVSMISALGGFASVDNGGILLKLLHEQGGSFVTQALSTTGIYLFGYGLGGMITGPFSEVFGRNPIYIFSLTMLCLFEMGSGLSSTIGTHIACRFVSGFFASVTVVGSGGSLNDIWSPIQRVWAFPIYASATYIGTIVGIVPSSLIGTSLSWARHWVSWIDIILAASLLVFVLLFQPETYAPSLMRWKARHLRRLTGDNRYRAPVEQTEVSFSSRLAHALYRPVIFMIREPIVGLVSLYLALIFIVLYTFLAGYIYIFVKLYHLSPALVGALAQSTSVGVAISWLTVPLAMKCVQRDVALASSRGHSRPPPEISLYMAMFGAPAIPISLFWLGWTARPSISPWSALGASALFGYGSICVIISMLQYIADTFEFYAASAMGTVSLVRFAAAGGVVTVSFPFYENLGVGDTLTILACLSFAMLPMPYIFYKFGHHIRRLSIYAVR